MEVLSYLGSGGGGGMGKGCVGGVLGFSVREALLYYTIWNRGGEGEAVEEVELVVVRKLLVEVEEGDG